MPYTASPPPPPPPRGFIIVNGCLRPTSVNYLPVLSGIAPPALRREHHTSMLLVKKALLDTSHLLHARIATAQNLCRQRLRSRRPFSCQAASLANSNFNLMEQWKHDWQELIKPVQLIIPPGTNILSPSQRVGRAPWTASALESVVSAPTCTAAWGLRPSAACLCGAPEQTADHILSECTWRYYLEIDPDPIAMVIRVEQFIHKPCRQKTHE